MAWELTAELRAELYAKVEQRVRECRDEQSPELHLAGWLLTEIPAVVFTLMHLETLDLHSNQLSTLPNAISSLHNLQDLYLNDNRLSTLPESIAQLHNLQHLDLSNNQLSTLPESITQLHNLQHLDLSNNQLSTLPEAIPQLHNLRILNLNNNRLSTLPEAIPQLHNLQDLFLSGNQLSTLPEAIPQLHNLRSLDLSRNQLSTLPEAIPQLHNLRILNLSYNQLNTLPEAIPQLHKLQYLFLSDNQLSTLPDALAQLHNLQTLWLDNNQLKHPPQEVAEQGIEAIRNYFTEYNANHDKLYEIKLLLVGEGRVGKTSLAKSLTIDDYVLEDEQSTEGIDIHTWTLPKEELGIEKDFRVNIWDFGGQEIYHATHQFFLTKRSLYLLVAESRKEDKHDDFYYWFNIIQLLGDRSPILVVLNKCDQPTRDLPVAEYQDVFPTIVHPYPLRVSCHPDPHHRRTIAELRSEIGRILTDKALLAHVGEALPKVWIDIRTDLGRLRSDGKDYISRTDYLDLCAEHNMDEERANFLSDYFHDIGVMLHYRHDFDLGDLVVLNFEWVTDGVYAVLDDKTVIANQGRFDNDDLNHIWSAPKYRERRHELLALMRNRKFEICYDLPTGGYLAPALLPVDRMDYPWGDRQADRQAGTPARNLRFEYRYDFMPKGMFTRFIVKRHQDIYQGSSSQPIHWRHGVLLAYGDTRAIVQEEYFKRKITIRLEGPEQKRFLDIIRKTWEEIHDTFNNLVIDEMLPCNCPECITSNSPHFYRHKIIQRYLDKQRTTIICDKSVDEVDVQSLLNDALYPRRRYDASYNQQRHLRHHLAQLYPTLDDIRPLLADAGIDHTRITLNGTAQAMWHNILEEAEHSDKLHHLLDIARQDYPRYLALWM
ncbi:MAG: leucine-rich repeat protein [Chloroflexota bacterium]